MSHAEALRISGLQPLTGIDYPGALAAVVFTQGCPWRCRYCHNPELQPAKSNNNIPWQDVKTFLEKRIGLLDAVVFSGGEPTAQPAVIPALEEVRRMGFKTGLHSAGIYPKRLKKLLPLLDWIGLDVKALPAHYPAITGITASGKSAWESARLVLASGARYQFRITANTQWLSHQAVLDIQKKLTTLGSTNTVIQEGRIAIE